MAARYDHFHAKFKYEDKHGEIEGGWAGFPKDWHNYSKEDQDRWWKEKCISWGMPRGAEILNISLRG